jgi:hypothetical protein
MAQGDYWEYLQALVQEEDISLNPIDKGMASDIIHICDLSIAYCLNRVVIVLNCLWSREIIDKLLKL